MLMFFVPAMYGLDSGAERAGVDQPMDALGFGNGWLVRAERAEEIPPPFQRGNKFPDTSRGVARAGMLRAVGALCGGILKRKKIQSTIYGLAWIASSGDFIVCGNFRIFVGRSFSHGINAVRSARL